MPPSVSELTAQASAWFFQYPWVLGSNPVLGGGGLVGGTVGQGQPQGLVFTPNADWMFVSGNARLASTHGDRAPRATSAWYGPHGSLVVRVTVSPGSSRILVSNANSFCIPMSPGGALFAGSRVYVSRLTGIGMLSVRTSL